MSDAITDFDEFYRENRGNAVRWASALDCAPATVRVLLHRGLATLKKEITL